MSHFIRFLQAAKPHGYRLFHCPVSPFQGVIRVLYYLSPKWRFEREHLQSKVNSTLSLILSTEKYTIEMLEKILFVSQSWIQPLIDQTLNLESLYIFSDLKNAFAYIQENQKADVERPYPKLEAYCEICNTVGGIFGENDESIQLSQEELNLLQDECFSEIKMKDDISQTIICYAHSIFESNYYFLNYFTGVKDRICSIDNCIFQIENILFNILWNLDCDFGNHTGNSYFMKAVHELSNMK